MLEQNQMAHEVWDSEAAPSRRRDGSWECWDATLRLSVKLQSTEIKLSEMHLKGKAQTCHKEWTLETEDKTFLR